MRQEKMSPETKPEPEMIERQPEIPDLPPVEASEEAASQSTEEETERQKLKEEIASAKTLDDLRSVLSQIKGIPGSKEFFPSEYIIAKIDEAEQYLMENLDRIVLGAISGAYDAERRVLGEKTNLITQGQDLQLRKKVRDIMKATMAKRYDKYKDKFEAHKLRYVTGEVKGASDIRQLEKVVKQVQPIAEEKKSYKAQDMSQALDMMVEYMKAPTPVKEGEHVNFLYLQGQDFDQKIEAAYSANAADLPEYAGIRERAHDVLKPSVKEEQVGEYISSTSSEDDRGVIRRGWQKLRGWFKRK